MLDHCWGRLRRRTWRRDIDDLCDGKDDVWEVACLSMLLGVVTIVRMIWMVVYDLANEFMRQCLWYGFMTFMI